MRPLGARERGAERQYSIEGTKRPLVCSGEAPGGLWRRGGGRVRLGLGELAPGSGVRVHVGLRLKMRREERAESAARTALWRPGHTLLHPSGLLFRSTEHYGGKRV